VMCRGNKGHNIFLDDDDRQKFLFLLSESLEIYQVILYVHVLMNNHFHLVIQTRRANLGEFMRRFNICYTGWFNYHHSTYGHLYQGRYKSLLVNCDEYLLQLSRYIHLNPVRKNTSRYVDYHKPWHALQRYQWSSLHGYLHHRKTNGFTNYDLLLEMAGGRRSYRRFILDGLIKGVRNPFDDVQHRIILGNDNFVARVKKEYMKKGSLREQPIYRNMIRSEIAPEIIISCVTDILGIRRENLLERYGSGTARGIISDLLYRYSDLTQRDIGDLLGIDYSSVNKTRNRLRTQMLKKQQILSLYRKIERQIKSKLSIV
jgi:putative transposase